MEKNTIIAIVLSIAVLVGYQYVFKDSTPPPAEQKKEAAQAPEKKSAEAAKPAEGKKEQLEKSARKSGERPTAPEKTITAENDLYKITLSSYGATVRQIQLKQYKDNDGKPLVLKGDTLVPALALGFDEGIQLAQAPFTVTGTDSKLTEDNKSSKLVFEYRSGDVNIIRTLIFNYGDYAISVEDRVKGKEAYFITLGRDFGIFNKDDTNHHGPVILIDTDRKEFTVKDVKDTKSFKGGVKWIAQEDKYFASFLVPKGNLEEARAWQHNGEALVGLKMKSGDNSYVLYAGPKEYNILEKYKTGMEHVIDFGFFSIISRPLFWFLKWLNGFFNNFGISIIVLTIVTRIPFIPIINKGSRSMKKMQEMQPRIAELKEHYKNDPKKMQQEMMGLYKKHKINPVGGCLPMVLQIPFFFALYSILSVAIELRQAPFMLWITDLSAPDTLFGHIPAMVPLLGGTALGLLPLVMGATTFIQQKMTPATGDPKQQKIMMMLPLVFTFMFLNFASGLVLFWLINNLLSIIQQFYINKTTTVAQEES
jgi:YidC/Oxa1 family membrane protein insertase